MATLTALHSQWHPGEEAVQRMLGVAGRDNPTVHGLKQAHAHRVRASPLVAFGALDAGGRPWVTVWGGEAGFCRPIAEDVLGMNGIADARFDPVAQALFAVHDAGEEAQDGGAGQGQGRGRGRGRIVDDEVIRPEGRKVMAALSIDLETRDRLKLAGRFVAGAATGTTPGVANLQMAFAVEEALGNCPKYLNKKRIVPHVPTPELWPSPTNGDGGGGGGGLGLGLPLPREAVELIAKADLFFVASKHGNGTMDVNHRGGAPGFLRVFRNQESAGVGTDDDGDAGVVLVYPEYSGNRLYQTLGNLREDPVVGLAIPDFGTSDVLYLTGRTTILAGGRAAAYMPRAKLAVRIDVAEARFVRDGLPFRGSVIDYSPYNPPVRRLAAETGDDQSGDAVVGAEGRAANAVAVATLLTRQVITPTISRYVFRLGNGSGSGSTWHPGQHVTFDFSAELDHGYSHMRDDDPQSLNDDFVRTFTVSAPPPPPRPDTLAKAGEAELEIVVRRHGSATALLANWNPRVPLEIPVLGFGGAPEFRMPPPAGADGKGSVFVAGGVGVTPALAQAAGVLGADGPGTGGRGRLTLLWSLRAEDLPLAVDVFTRIDGLGPVTDLFVTGSLGDVPDGGALLAAVTGLGATVVERRMARDDVLAAGEKGKRKFFCCTGPAMMRILLQWMEGEEVVFESFEY